jgi:hypothetical protein
MTVLRRHRSKTSHSPVRSGHVLLQRTGNGKRAQPKIRVAEPTLAATIKKAQPIINKSPGTRFRYARITLDSRRPWFKKGE